MNHRRLLVSRASQCDRRWAEAIARHRAPRVHVRAVEVSEHSTGTTAHFRAHLHHDAGGALPAYWFIKATPRALFTRALAAAAGLFANEARFYKRLAARLPVRTPECIAAVATASACTVVLEDLSAPGVRLGRARDLGDGDAMAEALHVLARLHAFGRDELEDSDRKWLNGPLQRAEQRLGNWLAVPLMRRGLVRLGALVPDSLRHKALRYARHRAAFHMRLRAAPLTLVHRDCHPGNWYWAPAGPGLLDWQLCRLGDGIGDVAYLLATSMAPEALEANESALLEVYRRALTVHGVDLAPGTLLDRYRMHLAYALEAMVVTRAIGGLMPVAANEELVRRTVAAVSRHGSLDAVAG